MKRLLSQSLFSLVFVAAMACGISPSEVSAQVSAYSQDFEAMIQCDTAALADDGWVVFGNVSDPEGGYLYGYGPFVAPNDVPTCEPPPTVGPAFSLIETGEGGPEQGVNQLSVFSDYENDDHLVGNLIESNVYREWIIDESDVGTGWVFQFDAKFGDLAGESTALAFIKTIAPPPIGNYWLTNFFTQEMTSIPSSWGTYFVTIRIDEGLIGQLLQIGFLNVATNSEPSSIKYDNIVFFQDNSVDAPELGSVEGHALLPAFPNPFEGSAAILFAVPAREAVTIDVYDVLGRRVTRLLDETMPAGEHRIVWSGVDAAGRPVASGTYFYRMESAGFTETRTLVKLR